VHPAIPWSGLAGVRVGAVLWGGLAIVDVGRVAGATPYVESTLIALLVVAASTGMSTATGLSAATVGWLVVDGFVEHRYGVLGYDARTDTALLLLLAALSLAVTTHQKRR
jgi:hypothetical protein